LLKPLLLLFQFEPLLPHDDLLELLELLPQEELFHCDLVVVTVPLFLHPRW